MKKTCMFEINLREFKGVMDIELTAAPLAGELCLHKDEITRFKLEKETNVDIMVRDNIYFKNLEAVEHVLTVASFREEGIQGTWLVGQDDLLFSKSEFRDWFALTKSDEVEKTSSKVVYTIEDYDLVGPEDFHMDRSLDKLRNNIYNKPWLNVQITFTSAEGF